MSTGHFAFKSRILSIRRLPRLAPRSFLSPLLGATLLLRCPYVQAQGPARSSAETLDAEGTALLNQRQLAAACPKLEQSFTEQPGTGVLLRLALCQELSGKKATAWASYVYAAERARAAGEQSLADLAQRRAAALEARLSRLSVHLDPSAEGVPHLQISRDGTPLELAAIDAPLPVDPGSHRIEAAAPGRKPFQGTIIVSDSPRTYSITITLPLDGPGTTVQAAQEPTDSAPSSWSTQKSLALGAGGIGVVGLTVGTILGLRVASQMNRARAMCTNGTTGCSDDALTLQDQSRGSALASTIAFGVGAAGILGGLALWLTTPNSPERSRDTHIHAAPMVSSGAPGIQAVGTW